MVAPDGSVTASVDLATLLQMTSDQMIIEDDYSNGGNQYTGPVIKINFMDTNLGDKPIPVSLLPEGHKYARQMASEGLAGKTVTFKVFWHIFGGANVRYQNYSSWVIEFLVKHEAYHAWETYTYGLDSVLSYQLANIFTDYNYIPGEIRADYYALFGTVLPWSCPLVNVSGLVQLMQDLEIKGRTEGYGD